MTISRHTAAKAADAIGRGHYSVVLVYASSGVREIEIPPARTTPALVEALKSVIHNAKQSRTPNEH